MTDDKVKIEDVKTWLRNLECSEVAVEEINDAIFKSARRTDALQAEMDKLSGELAEMTGRNILNRNAVAAQKAKLTALVEGGLLQDAADYIRARSCEIADRLHSPSVAADGMRIAVGLEQAVAHHSAPVGTALHIVFDGMPGPEGPRFVEVETPDGRSVNAGEWRERDDGFCELVIPRMSAPPTTPTSAPVEDVGGLVAELSNLLERATPGPWQLQDGCSWRRIGTSEHDGNVLCPTKNPRDGHPDLMAGRGEDTYANLNLICAAVNALPALLALQAERDKLSAEVERLTELHAARFREQQRYVSLYHAERIAKEAAEAKLTALVEVVEAARDLVMKPSGLVNRGVGVGLVVVEKADKSDPHYRLCAAFEKLDAQALAHHSAPVGEAERVKGSAALNLMTLTLTDEETTALDKLAAEQDLTPAKVFQQALRVYQLYSLPEGHPERIGRTPTYGADRLAHPSQCPGCDLPADMVGGCGSPNCYWKANVVAPPTTPTSAPVEDVGGLKATLRVKLQAGKNSWFGNRLDDAVDFILSALSPSLIQPQALDKDELTDLISDAITDSMDMDWGARDGARAVVAALVKENVVRIKP